MKLNTSQLILACLLVAITALSVYAARPDNNTVYAVAYTVHNLSYNSIEDDPNMNKGLSSGARNYSASSPDATQVCVFCHTPHNASPAVPLWNRANPSAANILAYRLYTSSLSLSDTVKNTSKITKDSPSLLCLSCHDGKTAINVLHSSSYSDSTHGSDVVIDFDGNNPGEFTMGQQWTNAFGGNPTNFANLGAVRASDGTISSKDDATEGHNLTDDHPIGFSYTAAQTDSTTSTKLHTLDYAKSKGLRFFSYPNCSNCLECSSCHNPHVYYGAGLPGGIRKYNDNSSYINVTPKLPSTPEQRALAPFLAVKNTGSGLCLGCHIK